MTTAKTVCGLYTRVSSRNQADAEYSSLETQRERLEAYCKSQEDYSVYRVYEDGGYSADSLDRPALKEMLRDMRDGKLNCVLAYKIDRLTRSVKDFHVLMDLFDRSGVKFVSVHSEPGYPESHGTLAPQRSSRFCPVRARDDGGPNTGQNVPTRAKRLLEWRKRAVRLLGRQQAPSCGWREGGTSSVHVSFF